VVCLRGIRWCLCGGWHLCGATPFVVSYLLNVDIYLLLWGNYGKYNISCLCCLRVFFRPYRFPSYLFCILCFLVSTCIAFRLIFSILQSPLRSVTNIKLKMLKIWYLLFNPSFSLEWTKNIYHDWNAGGRMLTNLSWKNNIVNFVCLITLLVVQTLNRPEKAEHLADRQRTAVETSACFSSLEKANLNKTICLFTITRIDSSDKYLRDTNWL
jgi:hypothetical protein